MEEGLFPGNRAMGDAEEMEEERRLCYVAMTRAKETLVLTNARQRMLFGRTAPAMPSRFLHETSGLQKAPLRSSSDAGRRAPSGGLMQLAPGESVRHDAFGQGMVLSVRVMGNDALIEVAFDTVGTKKLMVRAAMGHLSKG